MKFKLFSKIYSKFNLKLDFGRIAEDTLLGPWNAFNNNNERELKDAAETVVGGHGFQGNANGVNIALEDEVCTGISKISFTPVASDDGQAAPYADVIPQVEQARDEDVTKLAILSRVPALDHVRAHERNPVYRAILTLIGEATDSVDPLLFMLGYLCAQWQTLEKLDTMGLRPLRNVNENLGLANRVIQFRDMLQADHNDSFPIVQTCTKHQHDIMASFVVVPGAQNYLFQDNEHMYYVSWVHYDRSEFLISRPNSADAIRAVREAGDYIISNTTSIPLADLEHLHGMLVALQQAIPMDGFDGLHIDQHRPPRVVPLIESANDLLHGAHRLWTIGFVDATAGRIRDFMYRHKKLEDYELVTNLGMLATQRLLPKTHEESVIIPNLRVQLRRVQFVAPAVASKYVNKGMGTDAAAVCKDDFTTSFLTAPTAYAKIVEAAEAGLHVQHDNPAADRVMWRGIISSAAAASRYYGYGNNAEADDTWECAGTTDFRYAYNLSQRRYDVRLGPSGIRNSETQLPRVRAWSKVWNSNICLYPSGLARNANFNVFHVVPFEEQINVGIWQRLGIRDIARIVGEHNEAVAAAARARVGVAGAAPLGMDPADAPLPEDEEEQEAERMAAARPPRPEVRVNGVLLNYGPDDIVWTGEEDFADYYQREDVIVQRLTTGRREAEIATWESTKYIVDRTIHCRPANEVKPFNFCMQEYITQGKAKDKRYYAVVTQDARSLLPIDNFLRFSGYGARRADNNQQIVFRMKKNLVTFAQADYVGDRIHYNVRNNQNTNWADEPNYGACRAFDHYMNNDDHRSMYFYSLSVTRLSSVFDKMFALAHSREEEFGPAPYDFDDDWVGDTGTKATPADFVKVEDCQSHTTADAAVNDTAQVQEDAGGHDAN